MAGRTIGRTACPECGFSGAHVRETEKCLYRYCPDCGITTHFKTPEQRELLRAKTRSIELAASAIHTPPEPETEHETPAELAAPPAAEIAEMAANSAAARRFGWRAAA